MRRSASGFTLFEILAVLTILLILAAILVPVLSNSKNSGHHASELNALRQLGAAGQLYYQEHNEYPTSASQLTSLRKELEPLLVSKRDAFPETIVQSLKEFTEEHNPSHISKSYRSSFIGPGDFAPILPHPAYAEFFHLYSRDTWHALLQEGTSQGWLVSFMPQMPALKKQTTDYFKGELERLTLEGGVIRRPNCRKENGVAGSGLCFVDIDLKRYQEIIDEMTRRYVHFQD